MYKYYSYKESDKTGFPHTNLFDSQGTGQNQFQDFPHNRVWTNSTSITNNIYKSLFVPIQKQKVFKGCVHCIFTRLILKSKREHLWNLEKCFLFHFKSSFHSRENQSLEFKIFKFHDVIKCLSIKQGTYFTKQLVK